MHRESREEGGNGRNKKIPNFQDGCDPIRTPLDTREEWRYGNAKVLELGRYRRQQLEKLRKFHDDDDEHNIMNVITRRHDNMEWVSTAYCREEETPSPLLPPLRVLA